MSNNSSSRHMQVLCKWVKRDIEKELNSVEPSHIVLCNLRMQLATCERLYEAALQKEAKEAAFSSAWKKDVADRAALCGF